MTFLRRLWLIIRYSRPGAEPEQPECVCCEDGYYCRHRCAVHPKPNGVEDSGRPWAVGLP